MRKFVVSIPEKIHNGAPSRPQSFAPFPNAVSGSRTCEFRRICHKNPLQAKASIMHENYPSATRRESSFKVLNILRNILQSGVIRYAFHSSSFFRESKETSGMSNLTSCDFYTPASAAAYTELARGNEKSGIL